MVKSAEIEQVDNGYIVNLKGGASTHGIFAPSKKVYTNFSDVVKELIDYFSEDVSEKAMRKWLIKAEPYTGKSSK